MIQLIISAILVLGAQWYGLGTLELTNNTAVTVVVDFLLIIALAGMLMPSRGTMVTDLMEADIRSTKYD